MNVFTTYSSINELYQSSGYAHSNREIPFDIIDFSFIGTETKKVLPPHRRNFYTILFFENQKEGHIRLNTEHHDGLSNALLFQGPEHVFSFMRDDHVTGFIILFHRDFLLPFYTDPAQEFPFFSIYNQNLFHLNDHERHGFSHIINSLFIEKQQQAIAKPLLLAFLQKSMMLYRQYEREESFISHKDLFMRKFKQLIGNHFTKSKNVEYYADLLSISPSYLNEISKSQTGKTSKQLIMERILLESQNLLLHTDLDIAQIAHTLNFSEPTHFVKFFKKEAGYTPKIYRTKHP